MWAALADQAETAAFLAEQRQVFAEDANLLDRLGLELDGDADRLPIAAQEIAHRRSRADLGEPVIDVLLHVSLLSANSI